MMRSRNEKREQEYNWFATVEAAKDVDGAKACVCMYVCA